MDQSKQGASRPDRRRFLLSASAALAGLSLVDGGRAFGSTEEWGDEMKGLPGEAKGSLDVVIYLYDRMTVLDAVGPYEVFRLVPGARVRFAAKRAGLVRPDSGLQMLNAEYGIADVKGADVLVVPGGDVSAQMGDAQVLEWVRAIHAKTKWTTSVCVGSLILGAAGLLKGLRATTHWSAAEGLKMFGAEYAAERSVRQGKIVTAAGVSAGIDMALALVGLERGEELAQTIQLLIEYDPRPPFDTGSRGKASPEMVERARRMLADIYSPEK